MAYLVVEMQTWAEGGHGSLKTEFDDRSLAEQQYHLVLAAAAVSNCPLHSAVLLDFSGRLLKREQYTHDVQPVAEEVVPNDQD